MYCLANKLRESIFWCNINWVIWNTYFEPVPKKYLIFDHRGAITNLENDRNIVFSNIYYCYGICEPNKVLQNTYLNKFIKFYILNFIHSEEVV